jgi:hypothetical protein
LFNIDKTNNINKFKEAGLPIKAMLFKDSQGFKSAGKKDADSFASSSE